MSGNFLNGEGCGSMRTLIHGWMEIRVRGKKLGSCFFDDSVVRVENVAIFR